MNLRTGNITVQELQMIHKSFKQMKRLCGAMPQKELAQMNSLDSALQKRLDELQEYTQQLNHLQYLCHSLDSKICGKKIEIHVVCCYAVF